MNVLFLSPAFPPNAYLYCTALRARGASVVAVGDVPPSGLTPELGGCLLEYVFEPQMADYEALRRAVEGLVARHGRIDRLDSNGEHWLAAEARLRDDFGVPGLRPARLARQRSKLGMAELFASAGVSYPPGVRCDSPAVVRGFAGEHGFPLVIKPDTGSGAVDTFPVMDERELEAALARPLHGALVQPFVTGDIVTYDGLVDGEGEVVFCTSHVYDQGIMQLRRSGLDGWYYSRREIPPALEALGRRVVAAFDVRERFFHVEFFARPDGEYVALEMNLRPPGGFTPEMMNAACDIDVYDLWAAIITGASTADFRYGRDYFTAHAGRRDERKYRISHESLVAQLGSRLVSHRPVPKEFAATMGDHMYLLRDPEFDLLRNAIALVQSSP